MELFDATLPNLVFWVGILLGVLSVLLYVAEHRRSSKTFLLDRAVIIFSLGVLAFTVLRFAAVMGSFVSYGVNPIHFLIVDLVTAVPYALGGPKIVDSIVTKKIATAFVWGIMFTGGMVAPFLYVGVSASNLPSWLVVLLLGYLSLVCGLATIRIRQSLLKQRH